jgi:hypothetical protein
MLPLESCSCCLSAGRSFPVKNDEMLLFRLFKKTVYIGHNKNLVGYKFSLQFRKFLLHTTEDLVTFLIHYIAENNIKSST